LVVSSMIGTVGLGQRLQPVKWNFSAENCGKNEATVVITATMKNGWHIYSRFLEEGGPAPTAVTFKTSKDYVLMGKMTDEGKLIEKYDSTFLMPIAWFENKAVFTQRIKLKSASANIKGTVKFMACTEEECLLPEEIPFQVEAGSATSPVLQGGD
jgi:hypothetical protein